MAAQVSGVTGLNNLSLTTNYHTAPVRADATASTGRTQSGMHAQAVTPQAGSPTLCSSVSTTLNGYGVKDTQRYYSPGALASVYGLSRSATAGAGVKVGVVEMENVSTAALANYQSCLGTSSSVSYVKIDGGPTAAASVANNVGIESALDIEDLIGLAPGASIIDYEGPDAATDQDMLDAYQAMVTADQVQVISTSWGACEAGLQAADPGQFAAENTIFAEAAAQGQSVVAAAGDTGSTDCYRGGGSLTSTVSVDDPAGQPYVTGVGGTWMNGSGSSLKQTAWNENEAWASGGGSGGGGVSKVWSNGGAAPFNYQTGFTGSGYSNQCGAASGQVCRQVPDVSALADPATGYLLALDSGHGINDWYIIGGTSGAAPTWAAMLAQADSTASCKADGPVGQVNPTLYAAARTTYSSSFYDVTSGSNDWQPSGYTGGNYPATSGYDLATGLGTPKYAGLLTELCGAKTGGSTSTFNPVTPTPILDTRSGTGGYSSPIGANGTDSVALTALPANANPTSVVLNVTAINPSAPGYIAVYGDGGTPGSATVDFTKGQIVPNTVVVPVTDGKVDFYNRFGTVNVDAVITGYYSTAPGGSTFTGVTPAHLLDTRSGIGQPSGGALGPNSTITVQTTGVAGSNVPGDGSVTAVALNVTAISGTANSYVGVYPGDSGPAAATSVSFAPGQIIANTEIVPVGPDGTVKFYNHAGSVNVTADITGYYSNAASGAAFNVVAPTHLLDTRNAAGAFKPLGSGGTIVLPVTRIAGIPANATAVVLNLTVVGPTGNSYIAAYPDPADRADSTGLDFAPGQTIANMVVMPVTDGKVDFYNHAGNVNLVVDVLGYYAPQANTN
ncbi:hypothetical protein GXW82_32335 [Streptacidiphilus sp. 4-A2]|nr:hypothetical protein [Streptacidiphilus sp. 4-A2]